MDREFRTRLAELGATVESTGIVLIDHGSRRQESNDLLAEVAAAFRRGERWPIVEIAHMELAEPTLEAAFRRCVQQGARLVVVVPYFLGPGRHWDSDIPRLAAAASQQAGEVPYRVAPPIGLHTLMVRILEDRLLEALRASEG